MLIELKAVNDSLFPKHKEIWYDNFEQVNLSDQSLFIAWGGGGGGGLEAFGENRIVLRGTKGRLVAADRV